MIDLVVMAGGMTKAEAIEYLEKISGIGRPAGRLKGPGKTSDRPKIVRPMRFKKDENRAKAGKADIMAGNEASVLYAAFLKGVCRSIIATPGAEYLASRGGSAFNVANGDQTAEFLVGRRDVAAFGFDEAVRRR